MTRIYHNTCPQCGTNYARLYYKQKYCCVACALFSRIEKTPNGCWEWTGSRSRGPNATRWYGEFAYNGKYLRAHRVSFEMHYGPLSEGNYVLHTCDNPSCCNPAHLYEGTQQDNMRDVKARNRGRKKMTDEQIAYAEKEIAEGTSMNQIAKRLGVSHPSVTRIRDYMRQDGRLPMP